MATIDDLISGIQLSDEDKRQARAMGLLQLGFGILGARGPTAMRVGIGGEQGLQAYRGALEDTRRDKLQGLLGRGTAYDIANKENVYNDTELMRQQQLDFAKRFGGGLLNAAPAAGAAPGGMGPASPSPVAAPLPQPSAPQSFQLPGGVAALFGPAQSPQDTVGPPAPPSPGVPNYGTSAAAPRAVLAGDAVGSSGLGPNLAMSPQQLGPPGGVPSKRDVAQRYQSYGDYWMSLGRPEKAQQYYELAQKTIPQLKEQRTLTQNGQRVVVNLYTDGSHEIVPNVGPDQEKLDIKSTGNAMQGFNPFTGQPQGPATPMSMTPGERASNAVAWANNAETKRRNDIMEGDPQQIEATAQLIANGKMPPPSGFAAARPIAQSIMARVAQINPDYSAIDYNTAKASEQAFAKGPEAQKIRSFNVAISHLDTLGQLSDALNNGNIQAVNKIGNFLATQTGSPPVTNFNAAKEVVANEIVKAIVGSGGGVGDRDKAQAAVSAANSPAQLKGVIDTYQTLMAGQLGGLKQQYEVSTKRKDFDRMLSPQAQSLVAAKTASIIGYRRSR